MARDEGRTVITDARPAASADLDRRQRRYLWSMAFRLLCFGLIFVVPGVWKIVCVAAAGIIPAVAVLLANAQDTRTVSSVTSTIEPAPERSLTTGPHIEGSVDDIEGSVEAD